MAGSIYKKPILFAIVVTFTVLSGSIVMMLLPMMSDSMHPKLSTLKPYTPLQLAGRDVYQENGCFYCHTQTVRPLKAEVMRYGEYSKAGEFAYDQPFLWGSRRIGPDIAREGGKYNDDWHYKHFNDPRAMFADSNMPAYGWLKDYTLDPQGMEKRMKALSFPCTPADLQALAGKTKLDALVAYMQTLGSAVPRKAEAAMIAQGEKNPLAGNADAISDGRKLFETNCSACHGINAKGGIGPNLENNEWLHARSDETFFSIIANGTTAGQELEGGKKTKGGMPSWHETLDKKKIWSLVSYIRSLKGK
ncbi:MAG: cbb3-type cytochrome c oxidase subunit II [Nitrospirae bacterium]|nr:cbb3-type cytochrome c oxidase subunit II [Nitrospirota bacterium]